MCLQNKSTPTAKAKYFLKIYVCKYMKFIAAITTYGRTRKKKRLQKKNEREKEIEKKKPTTKNHLNCKNKIHFISNYRLFYEVNSLIAIL